MLRPPREHVACSVATPLGTPSTVADVISIEDFQAEVTAFLRANVDGEGSGEEVRVGRGLRHGRHVRGALPRERAEGPGQGPGVARQALRGRVGLDHRAGGVRRTRPHGGPPAGVRRARVQVRRPQPVLLHDRSRHGRPDDPRPRHRRHEGRVPQGDVPRRHRRLPAVLRARRRQRPGQPADRAPSATATSGSSTARRSGRRGPSTATSARSSPARMPTCPSTRASPVSWSTCGHRAWRSGRCAR